MNEIEAYEQRVLAMSEQRRMDNLAMFERTMNSPSWGAFDVDTRYRLEAMAEVLRKHLP